MDFSKVKLVVTDMDGTLLNSKHEVSEQFFDLFQKLKERDILFAAASGRQYGSIISKLDAIKEDIIVIAENGGFAMLKEEEIVSTPLAFDIRKQVLGVLSQIENSHAVLCAKDKAYLSFDSAEFLSKLEEYYTDFKLIEDLKAFSGEVMKIAVYHDESSERYIYPAVRHFETDLKVKVSGANWVDLSHKDAHKGHALQKIMDFYHLTSEEVLVFGDFNNDIEMLQLADLSFAMANAHPNVVEVANYQTTSNDDFGVERVLEKLLDQS